MNPTLPFILIDAVIVLVLVLFAWYGARKGLILTIFGMFGLIVALFGGRFVSNTFHEPIAEIIEPGIYQNVLDLEKRALNSGELDVSLDLDASIDGLIQSLETRKIFPGLVDLLQNTMDKDLLSSDANLSAVEWLSTYLATLVARIALFAGSFIVILLLWFLISRALDLAFKLPILSAINLAGGLILGLIKAIVIILILVWLCQLVGWIPQEPPTPILSLFTPKRMSEILGRLVV